ncbi:Ent-kaurene oxidase [Tolypocladium paradoxum]|uniref:Ent-kaurene oxidase n=1 Tax=Tolypocladium paradoxum TaxID=94208 RepID=A0A2S4LAZ0_9HYPO|nr:Ent-kaurene oxidase [Tolypocladium paradoxum]
MGLLHLETWQTLMPCVVAYVAIATVVAWIAHLLEPAVSASLSPKYEPYRWVKGKRGLLQFFSVAYDCVFNAGGLFVIAYDKCLDGRRSTDIEQIRNTANEAFLIPFPHSNTGFMLLLPLQLIAEYARQPESVVSFNKYVRDVMHPKYSLFGENVLDNNTQKPIVYRELFQKLPDKMGMMNEELVGALDDVLHPQLDENGEMIINMLLAPLVQKPLKRDRDIVAKHAVPIIEERMKILEEAEKKGVEPNLPYKPMMLVNRILAFNFLQSYSNTLTLTNSVYDLISLPQDLFDETVADLRNEINTQLQKQEGWTHDFKLALSHLLLEYDFVRVEKRPPGVRKVTLVEPCGRSRIVLRKRNLKAPILLQPSGWRSTTVDVAVDASKAGRFTRDGVIMWEIVTGCGFNHVRTLHWVTIRFVAGQHARPQQSAGRCTTSSGMQSPAHLVQLVSMLLASGHHRIMEAARGALVMMVLGKVMEVCSRPRIGAVSSIGG